VSFDPDNRHDSLFSSFLQNEIELVEETLRMTFGSKFEYNGYSGFEYQPSIRFLWSPHDQHSGWAAASRAVRTPARSNHDIRINFAMIPGNMAIAIFGDDDFDSEEVIAYEIGYRCELAADLSVDMTAFYNTYDNLLTTEPGLLFFDPSPLPHMIIPFYMENRMDGHTYGAEVTAMWKITEKWKVTASYSYLQIQLHSDSSNIAIDVESAEGDSPHNRFHLQSCMNLPHRVEFDQSLYYADNLPTQDVPNYIRLDLRLGWHPTERVELSLSGQNLLDSQHPEFVDYGGNSPTEIERSAYGKITWEF
jgi:iron complex outermembrane receptor protein